MSKFPAFQFYPKDCFTDETVAAMDDREFGFYMRCLGHAWLNDGIPSDLDRLARVMSRSREYLDAVWPAVSPCWQSDPARPDRMVNPRQERQRAEYSNLSQSRKDAAEARWGKRPKPDSPEMQQPTRAMQLHSGRRAKAKQVECSPVCILQAPLSTPETVTVRIDEEEWRDYNREEIMDMLRRGTDYLDWLFPEHHADMSLDELGGLLEMVTKAIVGYGHKPGEIANTALEKAA